MSGADIVNPNLGAILLLLLIIMSLRVTSVRPVQDGLLNPALILGLGPALKLLQVLLRPVAMVSATCRSLRQCLRRRAMRPLPKLVATLLLLRARASQTLALPLETLELVGMISSGLLVVHRPLLLLRPCRRPGSKPSSGTCSALRTGLRLPSRRPWRRTGSGGRS